MKIFYLIISLAFLASCSVSKDSAHYGNKAVKVAESWLKSTDTACGKEVKKEWNKKLGLNKYGEKTYRSFGIKMTNTNVVYVTAETPTWYIALVVDVKTKQVTCDSLPEGKKDRL